MNKIYERKEEVEGSPQEGLTLGLHCAFSSEEHNMFMIAASIESIVQPEVAGTVAQLMRDGVLKQHARMFEELDSPIQHGKLFSYGMEQLDTLTQRPDYPLASFFFVLSNLRDLPSPAEDLATEAMVYCEADDDYDLSIGKDAILQKYAKQVKRLLS